MATPATWAAFLSFTAISCWTPGPNTVLCAAHGGRHGWRGTLPLIGGIYVGIMVLHVAVGAAMATLQRYEGVLEALSWIGAAYILHLAWRFARPADAGALESADGVDGHPGEDGSDRLGPRSGTLLQVVNGKAWVHMLVLFGTFAPLMGGGLSAAALITAISTSIGLVGLLGWAVLGPSLRSVMSDPVHGRRLDMGFAAALAAVAIWIAAT